MTKHKKKVGVSKPAIFICLGLVALSCILAFLMKDTDIALLNSKGLIAGEERDLMLVSAAIMLVIAIPTLFLFYYFAWKYRETNMDATYDPNIRHGKTFMFTVWAIPTIFLFVLAAVMFPATHRLEPQKPISAKTTPITIEVIALRWKWLFIYPEQKIATVNFIQIPTNTPIQFKLTADEVAMSSFWIPHLGGQLYAMTGHVNNLNLIASESGDYPGSTAEINGSGFAGMKFTTRASSQNDFNAWAESVGQSFEKLDSSTYKKLLVPSENHQFEYYSHPDAALYDRVVMKYSGSHNHTNTQKSDSHSHMEHR